MAGKYTDDDLALLTEEERAGLMEEQGVTPEKEEPEKATEEPEVVQALPEAEEAPPEVPEAPEEQPPAPVKAGEPKPVAVPNWTAPADTDAKITALDAKETEVEDKFQAGELTNKEYREQVRAIDRERDAIERVRLKAEIAAETHAAVWQQQTVATFLEANPVYSGNETLFAALDIEVRKLQSQAQDPFSPSILSKAHAKVQAAFSAIAPSVEATKPPAKVEAKAKPAPKVPEAKIEVKTRDALPPSLAKVPAAEVESLDGGKFAILDRLADTDYVAFETQLGRMSDADRNAYLAGR